MLPPKLLTFGAAAELKTVNKQIVMQRGAYSVGEDF